MKVMTLMCELTNPELKKQDIEITNHLNKGWVIIDVAYLRENANEVTKYVYSYRYVMMMYPVNSNPHQLLTDEPLADVRLANVLVQS